MTILSIHDATTVFNFNEWNVYMFLATTNESLNLTLYCIVGMMQVSAHMTSLFPAKFEEF